MRLYSLYDRKMGEFGALVQSRSDEAVVRALRELFESDNQVSKYPEDFDLFYVGDIDVETGEVVAVFPPKHVVQLYAVKKMVITTKENGDAERSDA